MYIYIYELYSLVSNNNIKIAIKDCQHISKTFLYKGSQKNNSKKIKNSDFRKDYVNIRF